MKKAIYPMILILLLATGCLEKTIDKIDSGAVNIVNEQFLGELQITDKAFKNTSVELVGDNLVFNISYVMAVNHKITTDALGQPNRLISPQGHDLFIDNVQKTYYVNEYAKLGFPNKRIITPNTVDFIPVNVTLTIPYNSLADSGTIYYTNTYNQQNEGDNNLKGITNYISIGIGYRKDTSNSNKILTKFIIEIKSR